MYKSPPIPQVCLKSQDGLSTTLSNRGFNKLSESPFIKVLDNESFVDFIFIEFGGKNLACHSFIAKRIHQSVHNRTTIEFF